MVAFKLSAIPSDWGFVSPTVRARPKIRCSRWPGGALAGLEARFDNGGRNGQYQKILSGSIKIDGIEVAGNSDFNLNVMLIQGAVSLQANDTPVVDFNGNSSRGTRSKS